LCDLRGSWNSIQEMFSRVSFIQIFISCIFFPLIIFINILEVSKALFFCTHPICLEKEIVLKIITDIFVLTSTY